MLPVIIPQKGRIPSALSYILLTLFCIPFTIPITDPYIVCIPSLKSPRPLPNMSVWLISCGNLIGLGAREAIQIWTVWLVSQKMCSDGCNSCYILAAAQAKKWLRGAVKASVARKLKKEVLSVLYLKMFLCYKSYLLLWSSFWKCGVLLISK